MKLGIGIGYSGATMRLPIERVLLAERLGYDSVWTAETYGSDAMTPLAYIAALTTRIRLGTGIIQLAARTPANAVMQAATIDAMSGGRFICGIGVSGPQIVEGWYGEPWGKPNARLRDYVAIMKKIIAREGPVTHEGKEISLPYRGPGSSGLAKPLKSILHMRKDLPIWLGTMTETNVRMTAEVADGWLCGIVPSEWPTVKGWLEEGFRRAGNGKSFKDFEVYGGATVIVTDDVKSALESMRAGTALYVGGMGAREKNFHNDRMVRRGYPEAAKRIQELYLAGRKQEAEEAVPLEYLDDGALIGPPARIREKFRAYEDTGIQGLRIGAPRDDALELMAEITGAAKGATV
jgi:F420-dependent oxidoreductase-like protein